MAFTKGNRFMTKMRPLIVLVDMDGVLANFEKSMLNNFRERFPSEPFIPLDKRRGFFVVKQYEKMKPGLGDKCTEVMNEPGFFLNMEPIPGCIDALKEMSSMDNVNVFICTSPIKQYKYCAPEKYQWVEKYLGKDWVERVILTRDKTLVKGDILIDDKPKITGAVDKPEWTHYLMEYCNNTEADNVNRLAGWEPHDAWKKIINDAMQKL